MTKDAFPESPHSGLVSLQSPDLLSTSFFTFFYCKNHTKKTEFNIPPFNIKTLHKQSVKNLTNLAQDYQLINDKSKIFQYFVLFLLLMIGILNYINNGYFNLQKKDIKLHTSLVSKVSEIKGNPIIIGSYLDPTIPYLIKRKCVTLGNFKGNNELLSKTLKEINVYCTNRDHEINFCIMMNDQNFTHVKHLSDNLFGTSQYEFFDQYTVLH